MYIDKFNTPNKETSVLELTTSIELLSTEYEYLCDLRNFPGSALNEPSNRRQRRIAKAKQRKKPPKKQRK